MQKSLIALAVLGAFAGAASAQSSVTIYGKLDLAIGKPVLTEDKQVMDNTGSRLGFRGVEDLGGGLKAVFGIEHRFNPDTGTQANPNFWNGYSTVGLVTQFGMINLGRQYTPAFIMMQNQIDPFGGDTVAAGRDIGMRFSRSSGATAVTTSRVRVADSIRYDLSIAGFNFGASIAEGAGNAIPTDADLKKPVSLAANYAAGPIWVGVGYENGADADDKVWNIGGRYNFGFMTLAAGYGRGTTNTDADAKGWLVGVTVPVGAFDLKAMYATNDVDGLGELKKAGIGAHYNLSKRTKIFADVAKIGGSATIGQESKNGYDLGIQHNF
ncbi:MAG TPA: porin [Ideonella sp.]|uniref:porin n=1 Tax=Ideonella sp. TaxID=1929293 RepID=UPI002E2EBDA1|nr:porin [Ideonella sp.]HEX5686981.1 porin [Ideonella sp.]